MRRATHGFALLLGVTVACGGSGNTPASAKASGVLRPDLPSLDAMSAEPSAPFSFEELVSKLSLKEEPNRQPGMKGNWHTGSLASFEYGVRYLPLDNGPDVISVHVGDISQTLDAVSFRAVQPGMPTIAGWKPANLLPPAYQDVADRFRPDRCEGNMCARFADRDFANAMRLLSPAVQSVSFYASGGAQLHLEADRTTVPRLLNDIEATMRMLEANGDSALLRSDPVE